MRQPAADAYDPRPFLPFNSGWETRPYTTIRRSRGWSRCQRIFAEVTQLTRDSAASPSGLPPDENNKQIWEFEFSDVADASGRMEILRSLTKKQDSFVAAPHNGMKPFSSSWS
jgi:hypothetical protein